MPKVSLLRLTRKGDLSSSEEVEDIEERLPRRAEDYQIIGYSIIQVNKNNHVRARVNRECNERPVVELHLNPVKTVWTWTENAKAPL